MKEKVLFAPVAAIAVIAASSAGESFALLDQDDDIGVAGHARSARHEVHDHAHEDRVH